jgi:hypothetical protein
MSFEVAKPCLTSGGEAALSPYSTILREVLTRVHAEEFLLEYAPRKSYPTTLREVLTRPRSEEFYSTNGIPAAS